MESYHLRYAHIPKVGSVVETLGRQICTNQFGCRRWQDPVLKMLIVAKYKLLLMNVVC
jgi:hypothetical protein